MRGITDYLNSLRTAPGSFLSSFSALRLPPESCLQAICQHRHPRSLTRLPPLCPERTHSSRSFSPFSA